MADPASTWRTPDEYARARLGSLGPGQRSLALVFDPELLISWPEDGSASLSDSEGHPWRLLSFRGNDMALRARFSPGQSTVIWVRPAPTENARSIDLTTLADIVRLADAFVDVSLAGMLAALLPATPLPEDLGEWAPRARDDAPAFARALKQVLGFRGKPVSRRHVHAAALCQAARQATPELVWLDDTNLAALIASYARLTALDSDPGFRASAGEAFRHVASLLPPSGSVARPVDIAEAVARLSATALTSYLYVLAGAARRRVGDPVGSLANHGFTPPELTTTYGRTPELARMFLMSVDLLNEKTEALEAIAHEVERGKDSDWLRKIQGLVAPFAGDWASEPVAGIRLAMLAALIDERTDQLTATALAAEIEPAVGSTRFTRATDALQRLARTLGTYSAACASVPSPESLDLDKLSDMYVAALATAEYDFGQANRDLRVLKPILGEQARLATEISSVGGACEELLRRMDARLTQLLRANPSLLTGSVRAIFRWLPTVVSPRIRLEPSRRLWILVFDGLRWDLFERVLRPELEKAGWLVEARIGLAILPTETAICRRALLSGSPPDLWGAGGGSIAEDALARRLFEKWSVASSDLAYRLKAEDGDDGNSDPAGPKRANILIYRTPDRLTHHASGNLREVVIQFQTFLRENVLPEIRAEIAPDDLVFVTTDHGFTRVSDERKNVSLLPAERVEDRLLRLQSGDDVSHLPGIEVSWTGLGRWQVATDNWAFSALGASTPSNSFRHGGASLRELVVPFAELRMPSRNAGRLEIDLEGPTEIEELASATFVARVKNQLEDAIKGQVVFETNHGRVIGVPIALASGLSADRRCNLVATEGVNSITARLVTGSVTLASKSLVLKVRLKPGIKLSGLDKLEEDW